MWIREKKTRKKKIIAFAQGGFPDQEREQQGNHKLSSGSAMILGVLVTLELIVAGAMVFNIDFHGVDGIALCFGFMVLYFGVVAVLADQ